MKFKERFARWNKAFFAQYDIVRMMNLKDFNFKDFIITVENNVLTHKKLNAWFFQRTFESRELLSEFLFYYYQWNFYPKGGWMNDWRNNFNTFEGIKRDIEAALEKVKQA